MKIRKDFIWKNNTLSILCDEKEATARLNGTELLKVFGDGLGDEFDVYEKISDELIDFFGSFMEQIMEEDEETE
jgi:hypothetical protein